MKNILNKIAWNFGVCIFVFSFNTFAYANNLTISNVSLETRDSTLNTAVVEFDISWDNSWRNAENHDAVWIVLKGYRNGASQSVHGPLYASGVDPANTSPGSNEDLEIVIYGDDDSQSPAYRGAFIRRKSTGSGTVTSTNVRLVLDYGSAPVSAADADDLIVKVIGVEMVYIPEGPFYAGDNSSTYGFQNAAQTNPWYISHDDTMVSNTDFYYASAGWDNEYLNGASFTIRDDFPLGYNAFYVMKYELTEGQWIDFFNDLTSTQKSRRDATDANGKSSDSVIKRNTISWSGSGSASTSRENRPMNYISWEDLCAYLDWIALRPMTELEYEKTARGPVSALAGEYAWGSTSITAAVTISISPELGLEAISTASANANYNVTTFSRGDDFLGAQYVQGPLRAGIFATSSSTRATSGAGYYGVMELSGNLAELVVTAGSPEGKEFQGMHGDGQLVTLASYEGNGGDNTNWPGVTDATKTRGATHDDGDGARGGGWNYPSTYLRISDRDYAAYGRGDSNIKFTSFGGRGVRTASDVTITYATE